jgi:hypothetical protein
VDDDTAALAWLVSALEQARTEGQIKLVGYLEAVLDDVVFETEMAVSRQRYGVRGGNGHQPSESRLRYES